MNKLVSIATFFACLSVSLFLSSCDNDDEFPKTGVPGRPSAILYDDGTKSSFSYNGERLVQIIRPEGAGVNLNYEDHELVSLSYFPPPNVMDGHSFTGFEHTADGKILVTNTGEPGLSYFRLEEITLDADGFPVQIADKGYYKISHSDRRTPDGKIEYISNTELLSPGTSYTLLSFDRSTGVLLQQEEYNAADSTLQRRFTYDYDSAPGVFSRTFLPRWFWGYQMYRYRTSADLYDRQFFNYSKNLIRETIFSPSNNQPQTLTYTYSYTADGFPTSATNISQEEEIRVEY